MNAYVPRSKEENFNHTARQTYIAFMAAMTQAIFEGVDSTPMEGFEAEKLMKRLWFVSLQIRIK